MFTIAAQNNYNERYNLSGNDDFDIINVTGVTPAGATINMDNLATADGQLFNSSKVGTRNIVITICYRRDPERVRNWFYKIFKPKQEVRIFYSTEIKDVYIDGYVETFEGDLFEINQKAQISIICPDPFWKDDVDEVTDFTAVTDALEFPVEFPEAGIPFSTIATYAEKSVINHGEVETGVIIEFQTRGSVVNPAFYNTTTGEALIFNFTFQTGDSVRVNTNEGRKKAILTRNGSEINLLNYIAQGSGWFKLRIGDNVFSYTATSGNEYMEVRFILTPLYEGV